jgi:hypothetical protein
MTRYEKLDLGVSALNLVVVIVGAAFVVIQLRQASQELQFSATAHQTASEQLRQSVDAQKTTIEMDRRARALKFIERFNTEPVISLRSRAARAIREGKIAEEPSQHDLLAYLNFFEEMALAVLNDLAHEDICLLFFRSPVSYLCTQCEEQFRKNPNTYVHLRLLNDRWKAKPKKIDPLKGGQT